MTDRYALYLAAFVRAVSTGMIGVLLGVYLSELQLDAASIGIVVGAGLAGAACATLIVTLLANKVGSRRSLLIVTMLGCAGACGLALSSDPWMLAVAGFVGMVNGMGRDRGAALVIEQAVLPLTTGNRDRTTAFAQYSVLQDVGHALGALLAGLPALVQHWIAVEVPAWRTTIGIYAVLSLLPCALYLRLSPQIELSPVPAAARVTAKTKAILWKISSLFAMDGLGSGFLTTALISYFFHERFGTSLEWIAVLFFCARVMNAASHLVAAWLAKRIGLINTMVFTHIPSSLLLVTVAFAPSFPIAAVLFLLREGLVEMDVPTRQSYLMAVVEPTERTFVSGVTQLVRLGAWAVAPPVAGFLMAGASLTVPLMVGAAMKILYDVLLWRAFRGIRPPEEMHGDSSGELVRPGSSHGQ